ncbi:hypothetical protein ACEN33_03305 [Ruoffia sp. FAM 24228]
MTMQEFLFEHNLDQIVDLINRHFEFHGAKKTEDDVVDDTGKSAREFFSF